MVGYASVLGVAVASRLLLILLPVAYVSPGQQAAWSWRFFAVFALCFAIAVAVAQKARLPTPVETLAHARRAVALPVAVGAGVALLTVWSDILAPVAAARGVPTIHVHGLAAVPFYTYGAILLTTVFHFLPMALVAWIAQRLGAGWRPIVRGVGVAAVGISEDAGYFLRSGLSIGVETARHALSVVANCTEALFVYRFGVLGGLAQRGTTYLLWHLLWPSLGHP